MRVPEVCVSDILIWSVNGLNKDVEQRLDVTILLKGAVTNKKSHIFFVNLHLLFIGLY